MTNFEKWKQDLTAEQAADIIACRDCPAIEQCEAEQNKVPCIDYFMKWGNTSSPSEVNNYAGELPADQTYELAVYKRYKITSDKARELAEAERDGRILPKGFSCLDGSNSKNLLIFRPKERGIQHDIYHNYSASQK